MINEWKLKLQKLIKSENIKMKIELTYQGYII